MSEPWEYEQEAAEEEYRQQLYLELGPHWALDHGLFEYEYAVKEFTAERLKSYYVTNPHLAGPANDSLLYAQSLMAPHEMAALVFAVTATELAVKSVLLKPIGFGLIPMQGRGFPDAPSTARTAGRRQIFEIMRTSWYWTLQRSSDSAHNTSGERERGPDRGLDGLSSPDGGRSARRAEED
jgi:hypothetical protein